LNTWNRGLRLRIGKKPEKQHLTQSRKKRKEHWDTDSHSPFDTLRTGKHRFIHRQRTPRTQKDHTLNTSTGSSSLKTNAASFCGFIFLVPVLLHSATFVGCFEPWLHSTDSSQFHPLTIGEPKPFLSESVSICVQTLLFAVSRATKGSPASSSGQAGER
jgi:hypothetical protein